MELISFPDLRDKVVLVYIRNRPLDDYVVLERAHFEIQGGRGFVVGRIAEGTTTNDWAAGVPTALSWESVEQYLIFDTLEDYFARETQSYDPQSIQ
jgi:hypothetical protein